MKSLMKVNFSSVFANNLPENLGRNPEYAYLCIVIQ